MHHIQCTRHALHRNRQKGSVLILVTVAMSVLAIAVLMCASYAGIFFAQGRLQSAADEIALEGARKLNEFNRLGQMNDMIARSRQLVYGTNKQAGLASSERNDPLFEKLTRQLNEEAKRGAMLLEEERQKLARTAKDEARIAMQKRFDQVKASYAITLPWLTVQAPELMLSETGRTEGMQSNAQELQGYPELANEDKVNVFAGKPVNLYRAETDAKLPIADSPSFKFSPLPPAVMNDMAPARVVLPETFKPTKGDYAPCAAMVGMRLNIGTGLGPAAKGNLEIRSAALATGGGLWQ
jgi:hypothetical protein